VRADEAVGARIPVKVRDRRRSQESPSLLQPPPATPVMPFAENVPSVRSTFLVLPIQLGVALKG
jgi:hypothetical protein